MIAADFERLGRLYGEKAGRNWLETCVARDVDAWFEWTKAYHEHTLAEAELLRQSGATEAEVTAFWSACHDGVRGTLHAYAAAVSAGEPCSRVNPVRDAAGTPPHTLH